MRRRVKMLDMLLLFRRRLSIFHAFASITREFTSGGLSESEDPRRRMSRKNLVYNSMLLARVMPGFSKVAAVLAAQMMVLFIFQGSAKAQWSGAQPLESTS